MWHLAAPPGSACLPLGRRFHPINTLKLWLFVLSIRILQRHPYAPTQSGVTVIEQWIPHYAEVCRNIYEMLWQSYTPIP